MQADVYCILWCVCVGGSAASNVDLTFSSLAQEDLAILVSWCGSARILRGSPQDPKRQASEPFADGPRRVIPQIGVVGVCMVFTLRGRMVNKMG